MTQEEYEKIPLGIRMFKEHINERFPTPDFVSECDKCKAPITKKTFNIAVDSDAPYHTTYALCGRCFTLFLINRTQSQ